VGDGVVEPQGLAEVGVEDAAPVVEVLLGEGGVESVGVAECGDIGGGSSFAQHLDDGVAGNEMDEKEDDGDDDPKNGKRKQDATEGLPEMALFACFERLWRSRKNAGVLRSAQNDTFLSLDYLHSLFFR
jgi:hypothetical protein